MNLTIPPDTKFTIGHEAMGRLFNEALTLRIELASHVRDSSRPKVDEMFAMMMRARDIVEALKRSIKEQIPEAPVD